MIFLYFAEVFEFFNTLHRVGTTLAVHHILLSPGPALTRDIIIHTPAQPAISEWLIPLMIFLVFKGKIGNFQKHKQLFMVYYSFILYFREG